MRSCGTRTDVEPTLLGRILCEAGSGWVAVRAGRDSRGSGAGRWLYRFRLASGLPVGGWGVLRTEPEAEARLGSDLVARDGLDLYVAKPEVEYEFSAADGQSHERSGRSSRFFLAETPMTDADWRALGAAIDQRGIAARPG